MGFNSSFVVVVISPFLNSRLMSHLDDSTDQERAEIEEEVISEDLRSG